jgi:hypothetical protein
MGDMMTPATPVSVNSGMKATAMISVDENMGGPTSRAADTTRSKAVPPLRTKLTKMLSITMTVESTTMPKSTAPREIRLAAVPLATMPVKAKSSASGMLIAVMSAARTLPRNSHSTMRHENHADQQVLHHGVRGQLHQVGAVVDRLDVDAGRQHAILRNVVHAIVNAPDGLQRIAAVAHEHDALNHVGLVVAPDDAQARRSAHAYRRPRRGPERERPWQLADGDITDVLHRADEADPAHVEGLLAQGNALAADVLVGVGDGGLQLDSATPRPRSR